MIRPILRIVVLAVAMLWTALPAGAHEARPGYLELNETAQGQYDVLWKQPANGEYALRLNPVFPTDCTLSGADNRRLMPGAMLTRFRLACPNGGLEGRPIAIDGLEMTLTDVLVRLHRLDGGEETHLARATDTTVTIGGGVAAGLGPGPICGSASSISRWASTTCCSCSACC